MNEVLNEPNVSLMLESLRSIGYTFSSAVADIVDNSIAASATEITIEGYPKSSFGRYLAILDNGCGMTGEELLQAMRYGSESCLRERKKDDLGRFGLGLKSASFSQCRRITVITKKEDGALTCCEWDLDLIQEKNRWLMRTFSFNEVSLLPLAKELEALPHGTLVLWRNIDMLSKKERDKSETEFFNAIFALRTSLGRTYHRFINGHPRLTIKVNGSPVEKIDPFLRNHPKTKDLGERMITVAKRNGTDGIITVHPFVLPHKQDLESQNLYRECCGERDIERFHLLGGFYIYRAKRLISFAMWPRALRPDRGTKAMYIRILVDIPNDMDEIFGIDVKKERFSFPSDVVTQLRGIVSEAEGYSDRKIAHRARVVEETPEVAWVLKQTRNHKFTFAINQESYAYKAFASLLSETQVQALSVFIDRLNRSIPYEKLGYQFDNDRIDISEQAVRIEEMDGDIATAKKLYAKLIQDGQTKENAERVIQVFFPKVDLREVEDEVRPD